MENNSRNYIKAQPAYYVVDKDNTANETIIIAAIKFLDQNGNAKITPSVENSINKTIEITKREGVFFHHIDDESTISDLKGNISKGFKHSNAFILITCNTDLVLELIMQELHRNFDLYLVREQ